MRALQTPPLLDQLVEVEEELQHLATHAARGEALPPAVRELARDDFASAFEKPGSPTSGRKLPRAASKVSKSRHRAAEAMGRRTSMALGAWLDLTPPRESSDPLPSTVR